MSKEVHSAQSRKIGLLIPSSGPDALYGASGRNCAQLAAAEINARGGIAGLPVELLERDAGGGDVRRAVEHSITLLQRDKVEAFVALHTSAIRLALVKELAGRVPYVYTTTYEGGECSKGTYLLGETPDQQLRPVIPWISRAHGIKRWYLVGNDYIWPKATNAKVKKFIGDQSGVVVGERYVPFGFKDFEALISEIRATSADAVLITLVGSTSIDFNQLFARAGLSQRCVRLSTFLDEVTLEGIGSKATENLYSSSGFFAGINTSAARAFSERYYKTFGVNAPVLNVTGQACYEGLRLLEVMGNKAGGLSVEKTEAVAQWQITDGPRGITVMNARHAVRDIYLAKADGVQFRIVKTFEAVASGEKCSVTTV